MDAIACSQVRQDMYAVSGAVALVWGILRVVLAFLVFRTQDVSIIPDMPVTV